MLLLIRFKKKTWRQTPVDKKNPDFYITIYIKDNRILVFLNSSGKPLFMRGYRTKIHKAAINESLASGILKSTNFNKNKVLYDPMCGTKF